MKAVLAILAAVVITFLLTTTWAGAQTASERPPGVDEETWLYHMRRGEYSRWFREVIKDADLAAETEPIERMADASARDTRALIRAAIDKRYTAPA